MKISSKLLQILLTNVHFTDRNWISENVYLRKDTSAEWYDIIVSNV